MSKPLIYINTTTDELKVSVNMSFFPSSVLDDILPSSTITAFIYNSEKRCVSSLLLLSKDQYTYSGILDLTDFGQDYYYTIVSLEYEDFTFHSFPSDLVNYSPISTDNVSSLNVIVLPLVMILVIVIQSYMKKILKSINKKELIKK